MNVWPQLYAKSSTGRIKTWQITVIGTDSKGPAQIVTRFGQLGGKMQEKFETIKEGKNIGKVNETTPYEQACLNAQSDYNKKVDKKYITEIPNGNNEPDILLPMLALPFNKRKHNIKYPAYVQAKLNGVRCLATKISNTEIKFTSRKCKEFPKAVTAHLVKPLLEVMNVDEIYDGEFYVHGWHFQKITETVTKVRDWASELEYHVFDIVDTATPYTKRFDRLASRLKRLYNPIVFVTCYLIHHESEVKYWHDKFVAEGYEGVIIRNAQGLYKLDHRSKDLQKYKEFIDEEFIIVGGEAEVIVDPATKLETKAVVFTCLLGKLDASGATFNVRPRGTVAYRASLYKNLKKLIGLPLTVRYQELSRDDLKPIFPVGIAIRDYE